MHADMREENCWQVGDEVIGHCRDDGVYARVSRRSSRELAIVANGLGAL